MSHIPSSFGARSRRSLGFGILLALTAAASCPSYALDGNWNVGTSGTWSTGANWSTNPAIPGGIGSTVNFDFNIGGTTTITVDSSRTVGILNIGDSNNNASYFFTASGGATLTMDNGGAGAQINNLAGSANANNLLNALPIVLNDNLSLSNLATGNSTTRVLTVSSGLSSGTAGLKTITNAGSGSAGVAISGAITNGTGTVAVVQNSATSPLAINGNSSGATGFTGGLSVHQGTLIIGNNGSWGRGAVNIGNTSGSTPVTIDVSSARVISTVNAQNWNQNFTFTGTSTLNTGTGAVTLAGNRQVTVAASTLTIGGAIGDGGNGYTLTKSGAGALALNGVNTYTGTTFVGSGTLSLGAAASLASQSYVLSNGATFDVSSKGSYNLTGITGFTGITFELNAATAGFFNGGSTSLTLDDQLTLNFSTGSLIDGTTYNLFDMGSQTGTFSGINLAGSFSGSLGSLGGDLWSGTSGGYTFAFDESTGILAVSAVPEPSAYAMLGLGALVFIQRRRRHV